MFKQISNMHVEVVADQDWSSFLRIEKQEDSLRSAYVDRVRISWTLDSDEGTDNAGMGFMFCASADDALDSVTPSNNDGAIISASASRGGGGVVTLPIKRRITTNYDGDNVNLLEMLSGSSEGPVYLHTYKSDTNQSANLFLIVETWGRWLKTESL